MTNMTTQVAKHIGILQTYSPTSNMAELCEWFTSTLGPDWSAMGLLPDTQNCGLRIRGECRERFPRHRLQRKPLVSDPGMHHGTCVMHVPWCMSGSLYPRWRGKRSRHPRACATPNFAYLTRYPFDHLTEGPFIKYELCNTWQKFILPFAHAAPVGVTHFISRINTMQHTF